MPARPVKKANKAASVDEVVAELRRMGDPRVLAGYARFAIPQTNALGISVADLRKLARSLSPNHKLAQALWKAGIYEARMLATMVEDPAEVTPAQMDRWCRDFDNWAICDTACFGLFDRTPYAWTKVHEWAPIKAEYVRRGAFATLWGLTTHDKRSTDEPFLDALCLVEKYADDKRNFVKKAVNMALRAIGKRNAALHAAALSVAQRMAESNEPARRWNGKDALRELKGHSVTRRVAKKAKGKER